VDNEVVVEDEENHGNHYSRSAQEDRRPDVEEKDDGVKIEVLKKVDRCKAKAKSNDFVTLHFSSKYEDETPLSSTSDRGVPIEIQLGTKMISPGLDEGLTGMCVGEKRRITMPASLGDAGFGDLLAKDETRKIIYEVELVEINDHTTLNTFKYLDLNSDRKISQDEVASLVKMLMKALTTDIPGIDENYLASLFMQLHDRDGDNLISEQEFLESIKTANDIMGDDAMKDEL